MGIREIQAAVGGSFSTILLRVNELIEAGLIEESDVPDSKRLLQSTPKGRSLIQSVADFEVVTENLPKTQSAKIVQLNQTVMDARDMKFVEMLVRYGKNQDENILKQILKKYLPRLLSKVLRLVG